MGIPSEDWALAIGHHQAGRLQEAERIYRDILDIQPDYADAHYNLGLALQQQGRHGEACVCYTQTLRFNPSHVDAYNNLGVALKNQGQFAQAIACYREALRLRPNQANTYNNLGTALLGQGKLTEGADCFRQALRFDPNHADASFNWANALVNQGLLAEARQQYRHALRVNPNMAQAHFNLGMVNFKEGLLDEAYDCLQQTLQLMPDHAEAHLNLGKVLKEQGQLDEAIRCQEKALELMPDNSVLHSSLLYTLLFCPDQEPANLLTRHLDWNRRHGAPLSNFIEPYTNDKSPGRRLRVGYISQDLCAHPVGRFLLPLLEAHDPRVVEIYCYSSVTEPDVVTHRCRARAYVWRDIHDNTDEHVARLIRQDQIDILVDLTMHMPNNRLLTFARKPAPVQVTYLAYCGTTGLGAMDYRLTDPYLDPPGQHDAFYTEKSAYLPETYWCYQPLEEVPAPRALPALRAGHATFGCLNNFCKVTVPTLEMWSNLLQSLPSARLLVSADAGSHRERLRAFLAQRQVSSERVQFVSKLPLADYYRTYDQIDVALDPVPYGGGTTTCDALWMGVPVVTLAGQTAVGRGGVSILSNVGLKNLVAYSAEEYVRIAVAMVSDLPRLSELRATLRGRMRASALMNAPHFTRNVEAAYRKMWTDWCSG